MSVSVLKMALLWSLGINYSILLLWLILTIVAQDAFYRLNARLFRISRETFDAANFGGIVVFKCLIIVFNLAPYFALVLAT